MKSGGHSRHMRRSPKFKHFCFCASVFFPFLSSHKILSFLAIVRSSAQLTRFLRMTPKTGEGRGGDKLSTCTKVLPFVAERFKYPPGGVCNNVLYKEAPNPYPCIYYFRQKRCPFCIPFIDKCYPFHIPSITPLHSF